MRKKILPVVLMTTALLCSGCGLRTVQEMYALPRRSQEYSQLQSAIDNAMVGMTYCAPVSGDNQQTVQMADLDGDGVEEYLVFAQDSADKTLKVLIFAQTADGSCRLVETIDSNGAAFEQVEYVELDGRPGCELVIGRQVSDQVLRSVAVYTYRGGSIQQQLLIGYSRFFICNLDETGTGELMVIRPGETVSKRGMAVLYSFRGDRLERSREVELSRDPSNIRRISYSRLQDGTPAVFVASVVNDSGIVTDILTFQKGVLTNVTFSTEADTSIGTLRNYYIYAEDIDEDGVLELPGILTMQDVPSLGKNHEDLLLRWYSIDSSGREMDKLYTFHNLGEGWYLELDSALAANVTVDQWEKTYSFYEWDRQSDVFNPVYTIYTLTDSDRDEAASQGGRFPLYRTESVAYAAKLDIAAQNYAITEESLKNSFRLIRPSWRTGETQ